MFGYINRARQLKILFILLLSMKTLPVYAACQIDSQKFYAFFKQYRLEINSAENLSQLSRFFTTNFNQYYEEKIAAAKNESFRQRYFSQYWDNLNTAKDVVIVYDYSAACDQNSSTLNLISALNENQNYPSVNIDLWSIAVHYNFENNHWRIDSFEYNKLPSSKNFLNKAIVDNFFTLPR